MHGPKPYKNLASAASVTSGKFAKHSLGIGRLAVDKVFDTTRSTVCFECSLVAANPFYSWPDKPCRSGRCKLRGSSVARSSGHLRTGQIQLKRRSRGKALRVTMVHRQKKSIFFAQKPIRIVRCKQTVRELLASPPSPQIIRLVDDVSDTVIVSCGLFWLVGARCQTFFRAF